MRVATAVLGAVVLTLMSAVASARPPDERSERFEVRVHPRASFETMSRSEFGMSPVVSRESRMTDSVRSETEAIRATRKEMIDLDHRCEHWVRVAPGSSKMRCESYQGP